jgi:hypothetical protein
MLLRGVYSIEPGKRGAKFVCSMCINFSIFAGTVPRFVSKFAVFELVNSIS